MHCASVANLVTIFSHSCRIVTPLNTLSLVDDNWKHLTEYAQNTFSPMDHLVEDLSGRNLLIFEDIEAEVYQFTTNIDNFQLAIYFISKSYNLMKNFGIYILVANLDDRENTNTFMIELSDTLTIKSYVD